MSYAGLYAPCAHDSYGPNCTKCLMAELRERGIVDGSGVLHADNGAGYCVGHLTDDGQRSTLKSKFCPILHTPDEVEAARLEDYNAEVAAARQRVIFAGVKYDDAREALVELLERGPA